MFVLIHPGSRRQSFSSLPSQSSIKSVSSVRSQHSYRNLYQHNRSNHGHLSKAGVRGGHDTYRKASSPLERSSGYLPNHLPDHSNHIRAKCSNTRCGTNSKVKSVSFCSRCPWALTNFVCFVLLFSPYRRFVWCTPPPIIICMMSSLCLTIEPTQFLLSLLHLLLIFFFSMLTFYLLSMLFVQSSSHNCLAQIILVVFMSYTHTHTFLATHFRRKIKNFKFLLLKF